MSIQKPNNCLTSKDFNKIPEQEVFSCVINISYSPTLKGIGLISWEKDGIYILMKRIEKELHFHTNLIHPLTLLQYLTKDMDYLYIQDLHNKIFVLSVED